MKKLREESGRRKNQLAWDTVEAEGINQFAEMMKFELVFKWQLRGVIASLEAARECYALSAQKKTSSTKIIILPNLFINVPVWSGGSINISLWSNLLFLDILNSLDYGSSNHKFGEDLKCLSFFFFFNKRKFMKDFGED